MTFEAIGVAYSRYSFPAQFLRSSARFARRCAKIENDAGNSADDPTIDEHRGLVTATIMQSVAALEAECAEIVTHGPGHHLGSDRTDTIAREFLMPLADVLDRLPTLDRCKMILHLLGRPKLEKGKPPWQDMALLIKLRNELVHYKSEWSNDSKRRQLVGDLEKMKFPVPPFIQQSMSLFPLKILSAACAGWSVHTVARATNEFYDLLGVESPLKAFMAQLDGLHPLVS
jgi:hypothetical protein